MSKWRWPLIALLLASSSLAGAQVTFHAWARATPPGGQTGAIYGLVANDSARAVEAVEVTTQLAAHTMIHQTVLEDGVMKMRHGQLKVPAGGSLTLEPGGMHIMLMGLRAGLVEGCTLPLRVRWSDGRVADYDVLIGAWGQTVPPQPGEVACDAADGETGRGE